MNRRDWIRRGAAASLAWTGKSQQAPPPRPQPQPQTGTAAEGLPIEQYQPKSMLHVPQTAVPRSKYPVIDFHTHITSAGGSAGAEGIRFSMEPARCLATMDRKNIRTMVNLTGGYGTGLKEAVGKLQDAHSGRFVVFTEPAWTLASQPGYAKHQGDLIEESHRAGAKGIKVLKTLGLFLRDEGKLVRIDDARFDPMWEAAAALKMPVAIHISDPEAFFLPIDRFNERWEELHAHPSWSFYGKDFPSNRDLQEARRNVMRKHPRTQFVCLHVADSEDLSYVSQCLDSHPNMNVDIAARIGELGRQPRMSRKFFDRYQDRILFGTDASAGTSTPQQTFGDALYEIYYRFLESEDEYFDYAPAPVPPQGRWRIYGIGLPDQILRKVYAGNAARLIGLTA